MASIQLGQEIKQTAKRNGMTVSRLAKAAGIPNTSVVNYLYGTCLMSLDAYVTLWEQAQKKRWNLLKDLVALFWGGIIYLGSRNQTTNTMKANFQIAIENALTVYAESLGCTIKQAAEYYRDSESTRKCIQLLVLAQADPKKLKAIAA